MLSLKVRPSSDLLRVNVGLCFATAGLSAAGAQSQVCGAGQGGQTHVHAAYSTPHHCSPPEASAQAEPVELGFGAFKYSLKELLSKGVLHKTL